ncbi:hypothetical protein PsorP6_016529 [Peronosclerospora sorghi]|uniref:Uncharacterized protein n=1 Tax=Peronosclerospora sorghi TaxID=230839 RepID=A0ACC0VIW0_9STRA|nr:hypothetical protein PsorP6_016529 [Peronosclerospora sorghi]
MELLVVLLFVASPLFLSVDLALASVESNQTNGFGFQRNLRPESPRAQPLTTDAFKPWLEKYRRVFSYDDFPVPVRKFFKEKLENLRLNRKRKRSDGQQWIKISIRDAKLGLLATREFGKLLSGLVPNDNELWTSIGYYLAVLELADHSTNEAALLINKLMEKDKEFAAKVELGQFFLWAEVADTEDKANRYIMKTRRHDTAWCGQVLLRYSEYLKSKKPDFPSPPEET